jgi:hypothetical protein
MNEEERKIALKRMKDLSNFFYGSTTSIGVHPFIEFTGLINEYIKICERAHKNGIDFSSCNKHSGQQLPMEPHEVDYINEKLECIFTGRSVMAEIDKPK